MPLLGRGGGTWKNLSPWTRLIPLCWQFLNCKSKWMSMLLAICVTSVFVSETWPVRSKIFSGQYNEIICYLWEPVNWSRRRTVVQAGAEMNMKPERASFFCVAAYLLTMSSLHCLCLVSPFASSFIWSLSVSEKVNLGSKNKGHVLMNNFLSENSIKILLIKTLIFWTHITEKTQGKTLLLLYLFRVILWLQPTSKRYLGSEAT